MCLQILIMFVAIGRNTGGFSENVVVVLSSEILILNQIIRFLQVQHLTKLDFFPYQN